MESTMVVLIYIIPPRCIRFPFILHPCQCLLLFMFLMTVILNRMRGSLKVALICIFYIVKGVEHFFVYLMSICTSFFKIFLFSSLCHVLLSCWSFGSLDVLLLIHFVFRCITWKYFRVFVGCNFSLVAISLSIKKLFSLLQSCLFNLSLICWVIGVLLWKIFHMAISSSLSQLFLIHVKSSGLTLIFNALQIDISTGLETGM
jgi:hypothetical protein